jgi:signal peptidase I
VGLLLAVVLPVGVGHVYLGLFRRALFWLLAGVLVLFGLAGATSSFGDASPRVTLLIWVGGILFMYVSPIVDVLLIPSAQFAGVATSRVVAFGVAAVVVAEASRATIRATIVETLRVPAGSMAPNVVSGDHIVVDRSTAARTAPEHGEVIAFEYPDPNPDHPRQRFIKRVIAVAGDVVQADNGHPVINGWRVPNCYVGHYTLPKLDSTQGQLYVEFLGDHSYLAWYEDGAVPRQQGPYVVGLNELFVFGDNRHNAFDSRAWLRGRGAGVPLDLVEGKPIFVWYNFQGFTPDWTRLGVRIGSVESAQLDREIQGEIRKCLIQRPVNTRPPAPGVVTANLSL